MNRRDLVYMGLLAAAVTACGVWAFAPLEHPRVEVPALPAAAPQEAPERRPIELAAFRAPLWVAPPAPPPPARPEPAPPPPPPLKFQLLAIVREAEMLKAVLYDPDTDRLLVVAEGEPLGARRVERVHPTTVDIRDDRGIRTLSLVETQGGGAR
jgi:hypothetical protein